MKTINLLLKPAWDYKAIMQYCECGKDKAYSYMKIARAKFGGTLRYEPTKVSTDSVLAIFGTSRAREIEIIKKGGSAIESQKELHSRNL